MFSTKPIHQVANAKKLNLDKAKEVIEDSEVIRDAAQDYLDTGVADALDGIINAVEYLEPLADLGLVLLTTKLDQLRNALNEVVAQLPDEDVLTAIVEAWDNASEAVDMCSDHKENPRDYDADEKQSAREEAGSLIGDFANTLDDYTAKEEDK